MPFNMLAAHRPSCEEYAPRNLDGTLMMASHPGVVATSVKFHRWRLGFEQLQLSPYRAGLAGPHRTRLPMFPAFPTCSCPLQLSPSGKSMTQESLFELLLTLSRMQHRVPRRTVSLHSAQASRRPCEGPVSSEQPAGCTILRRSGCPCGEGSTSGTSPPTFATPSVPILLWFSYRDTA